MRKRTILVILLLFIIPSIVRADNIDKQSITAVSGINIGTSTYVSYDLAFKDVFENKSDSLGIAAITFELIFDENVFTIQGVSAEKGFDASVVKTTDGKYYYIATKVEEGGDNVCYDGILFCGSYTGLVLFYTNDTTKTSATFKIGEYEVILFNMLQEGQEITADNAIIRTGKSNATHTMTIKEKAKVVEEKKETVVEKSNSSSSQVKSNLKKESNNTVKKKTTNNTTTNNTTTVSDKKNNHLKELKIVDYEIEFDKYKNIYSIEVPQEVNELKVTATPESSKAKVKITGADNLKENNNKVLIEVTSEEGEVKKYIINVTKIKEETKKEEKGFVITEDQIELGKYILIGLAAFILLIFIIIKIRDRKVEKGIDKL